MSSLLPELLQEGLYIWIVLLLGMVLGFVFLAQKQVLPFAGAILRSTLSFFTSPFHYLRKTVGELSLGEANPRLANVDHYLLKKLLISMQVVLLLAIIVGCGLGAATSYLAFLPPSEMRHELAETRNMLSKTEAQNLADSAKLKQEDSSWTDRRQELVEKARADEKQRKQATESALQADVAAIQQSPDAARYLSALQSFLAQRQGYSGAADEAKSFINRIPSLTSEDTAHLLAYCDHWQEIQSLSSKEPKSEAALRAEIQPDHAQLVEDVRSEESQLKYLREEVKRLDDLCTQNYHPERMIASLLAFFLVGIVYVWGGGALIEAFSMCIYLANDVKQIRAQAETTRVEPEPAYQ